MLSSEPTSNSEKTKVLDIGTLNSYFKLEPEFVFDYTPDVLREVCEKSNQVLRLLVLRMEEMLQKVSDTQEIERPGFSRALDDRFWLQKMIQIARSDRPFNYDVDETCYAERDSVRQAKFAANEARRVALKAADAARNKMTPESSGSKSGEKKATNEKQDEPEYFLRDFRDGQLQITNFITRCQILRVGARKKGRKHWTEDAPLIVRDVSGFKAGDVVIRYDGQELRVNDIVTLSKILLMAATSPLGTAVTISKVQLMRARGGGDGGTSILAAEKEIERLTRANFKIIIRCKRTIESIAVQCPDDKSIQDAKKTGMLTISFHLLGQTTTSGRMWTIQVEPIVRMLFGKGISSWFDERVYKSIRGDFAKRLYLLYYSHANCYPLKLSELRQYLGSTMTEDSDFKDAVDEAHNELSKQGVIDSWEFEKSGRRMDAVAYVVNWPKCKVVEDVEEVEDVEAQSPDTPYPVSIRSLNL